MAQEPDLALVQEAISGDSGSFTELCRRYYPAMVAIAHSVLGDGHRAEDAAQEAFAKAVRKLPQLRNKKRFGPWLSVICRNVAKDMLFDKVRLDTAEGLSITADKSAGNNLTEAVKEAIAELSASDKEIIFLRFYNGMTYERISAVLRISTQAINGRLRRAKKKIADYLRRNGFRQV